MTTYMMTLRGLGLLRTGVLLPGMPAISQAADAPPPPPAEAIDTTTQTTSDAESAPPAPDTEAHQPNLVGRTGATGVICRSDRRHDWRAGDPRIER